MKMQNKINIIECDKMMRMFIIFSIFILSFSILATTAYAASSTVGNYTVVLTTGQTPYQLGAFFKGTSMAPGGSGWSWWDSYRYGYDKQKNLIVLTVLDNTTGTIKPVTGLASPPTWPLATIKKYSGTYSYKADVKPTPITTVNNYVHNMNLLMIKEVDLTGYTEASLTFWEWYNIYTETYVPPYIDYGYVMVSIDGGNSWKNLPGIYTTNTNTNYDNLGNGITGSSGGWVQEVMDLTPYAGNKILLGFRFLSDHSFTREGWYVDDIKVMSGTTTIFSDDAESLSIKTLSVNVTYPKLTSFGYYSADPITSAVPLSYIQNKQQVNLSEDFNHPGTYLGYFMYDPFVNQYSGDYIVTLSTLNNTPITVSAQFHTTILGCQNCHNKKDGGAETSFMHGETNGGGMASCMWSCHGGSRTYPYWLPIANSGLSANPMHVHEMLYGHSGGFIQGTPNNQLPYTVQSHVTNATCVQCHTSFVHNNAGTDTANIASYTLYGKNISFTSGSHENLMCENCHGSLSYPTIPQNQYQLQGSLGSYKPKFTSHESFTDTYIIAVDGTTGISITVTADNTNESASLYIVGPIDNTATALQVAGGATKSLATPFTLNYAGPYAGTWLVELIQRDQLGGIINYTITSNYPIQEKPIIKIPECNTCHNSSTTGGAYTQYEIPDWNPGFAHADTNDDGILDVQCRTCHDAMHNITTRQCLQCHATAPKGHPVADPAYATSQCLACHGDPHRVSLAGAGGADCIACHDVGGSAGAGRLVNFSAMNSIDAIHKGLNSGAVTALSAENKKCWACHGDGNEPGSGHHSNYKTPYNCTDCHIQNEGQNLNFTPTAIMNVSQHYWNGTNIITSVTSCDSCHNMTEMLVGLNLDPDGPLASNNSGHYGKKRTDMYSANETNCSYCHQGTSEFDGVFQKPSNTQITHDSGKSCYLCHRSSDSLDGRIHDSSLVIGSGSCIDCHREDVNISKFGRHANLNTSDGQDTVTDNDCTTCHYIKHDNKSIYLCDSCHTNSSGIVPVNDQSLLVPELSHGGQTCKSCHAPFGYHMDGIVGPKGLMDLFSFD